MPQVSPGPYPYWLQPASESLTICKRRGGGSPTGREQRRRDMKILVVEDDPETAAYLAKGLNESGYTVDRCGDGREGLYLASSGGYSAIVLDRMLPGMDGLQLLGALRASEIRTPALILSALGSVDDRVKGLRAGGDDYLVKPFAFSELLARIRTILRRGTKLQPNTLRVADLEIDLAQHRAVRGGKKLDLTPKEFALLSLLVRRRGEVLTRTVISEQVWDWNFDSHTNVVDVHMRRLRSKVDESFEHKLIQTVRGVGYVLEGPAQEETSA